MPEPEKEPEKPKVKLQKGSVEIDGRRWLYAARARLDGSGPEVSFDGGESWHPTMALAFKAAKEAKKLRPQVAAEDAKDVELPEAAAAGMVELVARIRSLRPGEELRIRHDGNALNLVKSKVVASFPPSVFEDVGIDEAFEEDN